MLRRLIKKMFYKKRGWYLIASMIIFELKFVVFVMFLLIFKILLNLRWRKYSISRSDAVITELIVETLR